MYLYPVFSLLPIPKSYCLLLPLLHFFPHPFFNTTPDLLLTTLFVLRNFCTLHGSFVLMFLGSPFPSLSFPSTSPHILTLTVSKQDSPKSFYIPLKRITFRRLKSRIDRVNKKINVLSSLFSCGVLLVVIPFSSKDYSCVLLVCL